MQPSLGNPVDTPVPRKSNSKPSVGRSALSWPPRKPRPPQFVRRWGDSLAQYPRNLDDIPASSCRADPWDAQSPSSCKSSTKAHTRAPLFAWIGTRRDRLLFSCSADFAGPILASGSARPGSITVCMQPEAPAPVYTGKLRVFGNPLRMAWHHRAGGRTAALLFLVAALLPEGIQGYFRGDPVQMFKRIQYESKRTVWSDVLVGQAPIFAVDRAIELHVPTEVPTPPAYGKRSYFHCVRIVVSLVVVILVLKVMERWRRVAAHPAVGSAEAADVVRQRAIHV